MPIGRRFCTLVSSPDCPRHWAARALEQLRRPWRTGIARVAVVDDPLPPGIDTPEDYARLLARGSQHGNGYFGSGVAF